MSLIGDALFSSLGENLYDESMEILRQSRHPCTFLCVIRCSLTNLNSLQQLYKMFLAANIVRPAERQS